VLQRRAPNLFSLAMNARDTSQLYIILTHINCYYRL